MTAFNKITFEWTNEKEDITKGYQIVRFNNINQTMSTGFSSISTTPRTTTISINGIDNVISLQDRQMSTFSSLVSNLNALLISKAVATIDGGNIKIESTTIGDMSTILIKDDNIFFSCTNFVEFSTPVNGISNPRNLQPIENWIINPQFVDFERCQQLGPRFWMFEGTTIRSLTDLEIDSHLPFVNQAKLEQITMLSKNCREDIIGGFESRALGIAHIYDSEEVDQLNLVGAVSTTSPSPDQPTGYSIYYAVRDAIANTKSYQLHTHAQLRQVLADGAQVKLKKLQKFATKKAIVESQTTISGIKLITWDSNP